MWYSSQHTKTMGLHLLALSNRIISYRIVLREKLVVIFSLNSCASTNLPANRCLAFLDGCDLLVCATKEL